MNDENEKEILRRELNDKELLSSDSGKFDPGNFDAQQRSIQADTAPADFPTQK
jgi:hypothetical protein